MGLFSAIFGPSKREIWAQIARDIGGNLDEGGWLGTDVLWYEAESWRISLDTFSSGGEHTTTYTRMRAPFLNKRGLRFKIYPQGFFANVGKALGTQDIQVGDRFFDDAYMIKGNNEALVREFLQDPDLRAWIQLQPNILFEVRDDGGWFSSKYPEGVDELYFCCRGVLTDEPRLKNLFDLFAHALERLVEIDAAAPRHVGRY